MTSSCFRTIVYRIGSLDPQVLCLVTLVVALMVLVTVVRDAKVMDQVYRDKFALYLTHIN